ncbi:MAG: C80 family cysteine peptidase [Pseudomonadota bacterium]
MAYRRTLILTITTATASDLTAFESQETINEFTERKRRLDRMTNPQDGYRAQDRQFKAWLGHKVLVDDRGKLTRYTQVRADRKGTGEYFYNEDEQVEEDGETYTYTQRKGPVDADFADAHPELEAEERTVADLDVEEALLSKDAAPRPEVQAMLGRMADSKNRTRLMIFAHGWTNSTRVAGMTPVELAAFLVRHGLPTNITTKFKISIISCCAAGNNGERNIPSTSSFAHAFHRILKETYGIVAELTARNGAMATRGSSMFDFKKVVEKDGEERHRMPGTKYRWTWQDGEQVVEDFYLNKVYN